MCGGADARAHSRSSSPVGASRTRSNAPHRPARQAASLHTRPDAATRVSSTWPTLASRSVFWQRPDTDIGAPDIQRAKEQMTFSIASLAAIAPVLLVALVLVTPLRFASDYGAHSAHEDTRPVLYREILSPLISAADKARAGRAADDPDFSSRVDQALNTNRLNIALLGYGEEHGQPYEEFGMSVTILSLNLESQQLGSISLSRDIRVTRYENNALGIGRQYFTLRSVYNRAGFEGTRLVIEEATGLAVDYQLLLRDVLVRNYLEQVSGPVTLAVAKEHHTLPYRLDRREFPADYIPAGTQTMDAQRAMTFILAEDVNPKGRADERSYRKNLLMHALIGNIKERLASKDISTVANLAEFLVREISSQNATPDFDSSLVLDGLLSGALLFLASKGDVDTFVPELNPAEEIVVHDILFGDGGVRRVHQIIRYPDAYNVQDNDALRTEAQGGHLPMWLLVPIGGDPFSTRYVDDYWGSVRDLVRAGLTHGPSKYAMR